MSMTQPLIAPAPGRKIMVGMSGGVDSSVTALLLQQQGYEVEGLFMKNWEEDDTDAYCAAAEDVKDAQAVCDQLQIPLNRVNFAAEYWDEVFTHFLDEYAAGRTPNPDVWCNREIKFKAFLEHALDLGAERIATGHYAQIAFRDGYWRLLKGKDPNKDQSYFLCYLDQSQLSHALFPVGELSKARVRQLAAQAGLAVHDKKDSTGVCFIGERRFRDFLARFLPAQPGPILSPEGDTIGEHQGACYYTLGQREGLRIGGRRGSSGEPWYVVGKELAHNQLIAAQGHDHPLLYSCWLTADKIHWIVGNPPQTPFACQAKTRYRQSDQACVLEGCEDGTWRIRFDRAQRAVTPGQSVVLYLGDECLGGGIIGTAGR
jgi:tRNA-specific 2-thiouridylase